MEKILTYKDLKLYKNIQTTDISKIIFRTSEFSLSEIPEEVINIYFNQLIQNPEYVIFYFDSSDRLEFIKDLDDKRLINSYNKLIPNAFKADLWRYLILREYGGIYMDFSLSTLVPLHDLIEGKNEFFVKDKNDYYGVYNGVFGTKKDNKTINLMVEKTIYNIENEIYGYDPLTICGPILLKDAYLETHNNEFVFEYFYTWDQTIKSIITDEVIIIVRLENHYNLLYNQFNRPDKEYYPAKHYDYLWNMKSVFRNERWFEIEKFYKNILKREPDIDGMIHHNSSPHSLMKIRDFFYISEEYKNLSKNFNTERRIDVFLISVNYNDYLTITLKENKKIFKNIHVITSSNDVMCQKICKSYEVDCIITDVMFQNSIFNKGAAFNYALNLVKNLDYVLILDADIIVLDDINLNELEERCFYYVARRLCNDYETYKSIKNVNELYYDQPHGDGYFQLVNMRDGIIYLSESFKNCSGVDNEYRDRFENRVVLKNEVIHLGEKETNWDGRITKPFISDNEINKLLNEQ